MRFLSRRSIRAKLSLLTCFVAFTAVALACLGYAGLGFQQLCTSEARQLRNHAHLLGHYSTPILTLRNGAAGDRLLASLASDPSIEAACLFDIEQNCLSRYRVSESMTFPIHLEGKPYRLASLNRLEFLSPVEAAGQPIGFIYLRSNTKAAQAQLGQFARGAGVIVLVVFGVSCVLAIPLKRTISTPILHLAKATDNLVGNEQPSVNLAGQVSPECIQIMSDVNGLLTKINESTTVAKRATAGLEDRVAESSHGLAQELKRVHKRQHELEQEKDAAEAASLAKSNFIVDMGQEIRGSLDGIVDDVEAMLGNAQSLGGPDTETQLKAIRRHGQRLQHLIQDVSENATIDAGRVEMQHVNCQPHSIIGGVVAEYQKRADAKEIAIEYCWRGSDEESLCCDAERLRQVIQALVDNAIRFTEAGGVRVAARFEQGQDARQLRIEVTDTGIGINAEDINHVFDASEQATRVHPDEPEAVMGLHNCQRIISAMGGDITVNSSVGEGTAFTVLMNAEIATPRDAVATPGAPGKIAVTAQSYVAPAVQATAGETQTPRILVVDDSDTNRDLTQLVLRRAGASVEGAENGLEAVQAAIRESFDLILMDMQMPVMDGYSATREIRAQGIDVPIVALTAFAMEFDEQKCRAAGCIGHLTKPVATEDLLAAAERVLPAGKILTRDGQAKSHPAAKSAAKSAAESRPAVKPRSPYDIDLEPRTIAPKV